MRRAAPQLSSFGSRRVGDRTRGGPGTATETISLYLYKLAFEDFRLAYAGSAAFIVLIITVVLINMMLKPIRYQLVEGR